MGTVTCQRDPSGEIEIFALKSLVEGCNSHGIVTSSVRGNALRSMRRWWRRCIAILMDLSGIAGIFGIRFRVIWGFWDGRFLTLGVSVKGWRGVGSTPNSRLGIPLLMLLLGLCVICSPWFRSRTRKSYIIGIGTDAAVSIVLTCWALRQYWRREHRRYEV